MSQVFTHTPRPAIAEVAPYERQRRYGADRTSALRGLRDKGGECRVQVFRHAPDATAELDLETSNVWMRVQLPPEALRELARCLIDAAADIEGQVRRPSVLDGQRGQGLQPGAVGGPGGGTVGGYAGVVVEVYALGAGVTIAGEAGNLPRSERAFELEANGQTFVIDPLRAHVTKWFIAAVESDIAAIGLPVQAVNQKHLTEVGSGGDVAHAASCSPKTAILSLPQGAGKSTLATALAQRLGCTHIVDEWRKSMPVLPGALHLSQLDAEGSA